MQSYADRYVARYISVIYEKLIGKFPVDKRHHGEAVLINTNPEI